MHFTSPTASAPSSRNYASVGFKALPFRPHTYILYRHLLGKKSWNVYNLDNIARVKQDEEAAAAREAEEEQRMQEADAERRIQILRGLPVVDAPPRSPSPARKERSREKQDSNDNGARRDKKRRRIAGEDDTERDIRLALEDSAAAPGRQEMSLKPFKGADVSLTDRNGHINLFPTQGSRRHAPKNAEAEADATRKKRELEDQYTMRFSNAAGFKNAIGEKPWYHSMDTPADHGENEAGGAGPVPKNVWGNEDPRRKERERARLAADDPLAMIQKGVSGLREVERERKKWKAEHERETRDLLREERRRSRKRRSHHHHITDDDNLENFSLEAPPATTEPRSSTHESHRHRPHRHHHHERDHHRHRTHTNDPRQHRNHSNSTDQKPRNPKPSSSSRPYTHPKPNQESEDSLT